MSKEKKYKLFAANEGEQKICAFFQRPEGCRNGAKCQFLHSKEEVKPAANTEQPQKSGKKKDKKKDKEKKTDKPVKIKEEPTHVEVSSSSSSSVVSSESEEDTKVKKSPPPPPKQKKKDRKRKLENKTKTTHDYEDESPFAPPPKFTPVKQFDDEEEEQEGSNNQNHVTSESSSKKKKKKQKLNPEETTTPKKGFESLLSSLPITPKTEEATNGNSKETETSLDSSSPNEAVILPKHNKAAMAWNHIIERTRMHKEYKKRFNRDTIRDDTWITTKPYGDWCADNPSVIAIDCEMCHTTDPKTGAKDTKSLCRLSVLDCSDPKGKGTLLLDTLVKPAWPITEDMAEIHGISKSELESVEFTLQHAQAFMQSLCSEETVIVGHSLQNDFYALKMSHPCVVDSCLLYPVQVEGTVMVEKLKFPPKPGLAELVASVFGETMPQLHDAVHDARSSWRCLQHYRDQNGKVEVIIKKLKPTAAQTLLLHRLKDGLTKDHMRDMFLSHTFVMPTAMEDVEGTESNKKKVNAVFASPQHASLAFNTLPGKSELDQNNQRLQKKVFLKNSEYIWVRMNQVYKKGKGEKREDESS